MTPCEGCPEPELLPENAAAAELFVACETQWRTGGQGFPTGLDYAGVEATARLLGITRRELRETFPKLQILEHDFLEALPEALKKLRTNSGNA